MTALSMPAGLRAALLLACGRGEGVALLAADTDARQLALARQSFRAMALCLPVFLLIHMAGGAPREAPPFLLLRELASFALGWLGFAVLSHRLAQEMGRGALWPRFIVLWNWCNLLQYLLLVAMLVPVLLGVPTIVAQTAWLVAIGWAVWLQWFATRLGLGLPGGQAALLVAADMAVGVVVLLVTRAG